MNEPEYEPDFKCATFDKSGITPEIRAKMDADRRRADQAHTRDEARPRSTEVVLQPVVRRFGAQQTKTHERWRALLDWSVLTIRIPLLPKWLRRKIGKRVSETARY